MKHTMAMQIATTCLENCAHINSHPLSDSVQFLLELWPSFFQEGLRKGPVTKRKIRGNGVDDNIGLEEKTKNLFQILTKSVHQELLIFEPLGLARRETTKVIKFSETEILPQDKVLLDS